MRNFEERWMRKLGKCNLRNTIREPSGILRNFRDDVCKLVTKAKVRCFPYLSALAKSYRSSLGAFGRQDLSHFIRQVL